MAGGEVQRVGSLAVGLDADRVGRTPGRPRDRALQCVLEAVGLALGDQSAEAAGRVGRRGVERRPCHVVGDVETLPQRGGRIAGVEGELVDERVRERMDEDEPRGDLPVGLDPPALRSRAVAIVECLGSRRDVGSLLPRCEDVSSQERGRSLRR